MNRFIKIFVALAFLSFLTSFSIGQKKPQLNIIGRVLAADGLMTDWLQYIYKDSDGFIWISFDYGFIRWDGYEAKRFPAFLKDSTFKTSSRFCRPILEDDHGSLFIGTLGGGLIRLDKHTDQYVRYYPDPGDPQSIAGNYVHDLLMDENGYIWIGSNDGGISQFDPGSELFKNFSISCHDTNDRSCNNVRSICIDSRGIFWIGTANGLYQFDRTDHSFLSVNTGINFQEGTNSFQSMLEDTDGNMWFGTRIGLLKYIRNTGTWKHINTSNPDKPGSDHDVQILCMAEYHSSIKHQLWVGTIAGLKVYDINSGILTHFNSKNGYPEVTNTGPISYLYIDDNDLLWAGLEGLTLIDLVDHPFQSYLMHSYPDSIEYVPASCFYSDDQDHFWVGSFIDGLYEYDESMRFLKNYRISSSESNSNGNNSFKQIYEDHKGRIWMLAGPTGLCLFDIESKNFQSMDLDIGHSSLVEIIVDEDDRIWLATGGGLIEAKLFGDNSLQCLNRINYYVNDVLIDSQGFLWAVTRNNGVYKINLNNMLSFTFEQYFHRDYRQRYTEEYNARYVLEDNQGKIWFMSEESLFTYDRESDSIVPVDHFNKPNDQKIYSFTCDKNGIFWFVWAYGLMYYNPTDSTQDKLLRMSFYDGLPYSFYIRNTFFYDTHGYLYCGGQATISRGFLRFHPDSIRGPNKKLPPVVITDFKIKNKPVELDSNITHCKVLDLTYDQNFFSLEFSAMDFYNPMANNYAYMLEGVDEDWVFNGVERTANYTSIQPGTYTFRVKGTNNHWYWNEEGTSLTITIHPPPWRTWWAFTIYGLALCALLFALRFYDRKRQRLKQALELEHVEANKLKELDSMKSRFFANISHEFRTPLTLILGPLEKLISKTDDRDCVRDLNMMQRNAMRLQRLINQLLNLSKLEAGEMKLQASERNIISLIRGYVHSFESLANQKEINLSFESEGNDIIAWVDQDKVEKILYNLISNAFKYTSSGGSITVEVARHKIQAARHQTPDTSNQDLESGNWKLEADRYFCIAISDTGSGIDAEKLPHIFDRFYQADDTYKADSEGSGIGLALTKELVELHHGRIEASSEKGVGSKFEVYLPLGDEHLSQEEKNEKIVSMTSPPGPLSNLERGNRGPGGKGGEVELTTDPDKPILLIVEDNYDLRSYIRSYLDEEYAVIEAVDGERGLESAINKVPDLVISDVMMPKMDGYQLCGALKSDERTSHIPVILLTAKAAREDKIEGLQTGADDFLTKPFDPAELQVRIKNLIEQRKALRDKYLKELNLEPYNLPDNMVSMDRKFLEKAHQQIEKHLDDADYSVDQFMDDLAMSKVQLYRKLKGLISMSANEFIRSVRLSHAAKMLKDKADNIAQISYAVGFNNPSYFAECFKKQFGVSPSEYSKL